MRWWVLAVVLAACGAEDWSGEMSYLTLNGWTIPVEGTDHDKPNEDLGEKSRTFDGGLAVDYRRHKQTYGPMRSTPMPQFRALSLKGMLRGLGDWWTLNTSQETGDLAIDAELYSDKGFGAISGAVASALPAEGGDGAVVASHAPFEGSGVEVDPTTTNLSAVRDTDGDAVNWVLGGGSAVNSAVHYLIGSGSVLGSALATPSFISRQISAAGGAGTAYAISGYLKKVSGAITQVDVTIDIAGGAVTATQTIDLEQDVWIRFKHLVATSPGGGPHTIDLIVGDADAAGEIAIDGLQLEALDHSTAFCNSGALRAAGVLTYSANDLSHADDGISLMAWTTGPWQGDAVAEWLLGAGSSPLTGSDRAGILNLSGGGNAVTAYVVGREGTVSFCTMAAPWDGDWHHVAMVVRLKANNVSTWNLELYVDGVREAQASFTDDDAPSFGLFDQVAIGHRNTDRQWIGPIAMPAAYPYPLCAEAIAGIFSLVEDSSPFPPVIIAYGDLIENAGKAVIGAYEGADLLSGGDVVGGIWDTALERLRFSLLEF